MRSALPIALLWVGACSLEPLPIPPSLDLDRELWGECERDSDCEPWEVCVQLDGTPEDPRPFVACARPCFADSDCETGGACLMLSGDLSMDHYCYYDGAW